MKLHFVALSLVAIGLTLAAIPATAQAATAQAGGYDNGPVDGQDYAWPIFGTYSVSDSFRLTSGGTVYQINFWAWLTPTDYVTNVQIQLGPGPFVGPPVGAVSLSQSDCFINDRLESVCFETAVFAGVPLPGGDYFVTLSGAQTHLSKPVYWDENSGIGCQASGCPSTASIDVTTVATIPSEAFTVTVQ